jgi:flagellar basal body rod protein FlgG
MKLYGGINLGETGMVTSLKDMHLQTNIMNIINENIQGFNKVGYQKKVPVLSSFAEVLGTDALSENVDEQVGRVKITKNPLDLAIASQGYFQVESPNGIEVTRDGRFKLDKDGNLLNLQNYKVLSNEGKPIKFSVMPKQLEDIKVAQDGTISCLDKTGLKVHTIGKLSLISSEGTMISEPNIKQGYVEESNVALHEEFFNMVPVRRNFEANRQCFLIQNDALSRTIQELGRSS